MIFDAGILQNKEKGIKDSLSKSIKMKPNWMGWVGLETNKKYDQSTKTSN